MKGHGKQAKILDDKHAQTALNYIASYSRYPKRDAVMFLLASKAGLKAKEICSVTWEMVTDAAGNIGDALAIPNRITQRQRSGRTIPLSMDLKDALIVLFKDRYREMDIDLKDAIIFSERGASLTPAGTVEWFSRLYQKLGFNGCSSHSGRRTMITMAARNAYKAGCNVRDVQQLAGHADLSTTQHCIEANTEGQKLLVDLI